MTVKDYLQPAVDPRSPGLAVPLAARRHPLVRQLSDNLRTRCEVEPGARLVLGVSGGADSLALSIGCAVLAARGELWPVIVHVHHHLRADAHLDVLHVEEFCRRFGLPFEQVDVYPVRTAGNLCKAAREHRYDALGEAAARHGSKAVAVAHHADDQFETILMALCRGAGPAIAGMRWRRLLDERRPEVMLLRPLLDCTRRDCESLCEAASVEWRDDPTNRDRNRARARLRADVIPVLESLWPGATERAAATTRDFSEAADLVEQLLPKHFGPPTQRHWSRPDLSQQSQSFLALGLRRAAVAAIGVEVADGLPRQRMEQIARAIRDGVRWPRRFQLPRGWSIHVSARHVALSQDEAT